ncbi:MAG: NIL domain-containing protein [Planctomycetota bacterium]
MRTKKKFIITFPKDLVKEPWNYNLITRFDIIPNIVAGTISENSAILGYEFDGETAKLDLAISYLREMGVKVESVDEIRL